MFHSCIATLKVLNFPQPNLLLIKYVLNQLNMAKSLEIIAKINIVCLTMKTDEKSSNSTLEFYKRTVASSILHRTLTKPKLIT